MNGQQLKNSILQMAVQGKLVPQDPNDEPASVLIQRIREEKEKLIKEKKIKKEKNPSYIFRGSDNLHYEKVGDSAPVCIEKELPFEIPDSWVWTRLNCCVDVRDGTHDSPKYVQDGIPLITSKNLHDGYLDMGSAKFISQEDHKKISERSRVDNNDILFAMIGSIGNPVLYCGEANKFSIKNMALFKYIHNGMIMKYVYWWLFFSQYAMRKDSSGGVQSFVSLNYLRNYYIPVPPLAEQQRIVAKIEQILPYIKEYELSESRIGQLNVAFPEQLKKSILQEAVQGKLVPQDPSDEPASILLEKIAKEKEMLIKEGKIKKQKSLPPITEDEIPFDIPNSWEWVRLGNVCEIARGGSPRPIKQYLTESSNGVNWIKIGDTSKDSKYINSTNERIIAEGVAKSRFVHKGDFLLTNSMSFGRPYILNIDGCIHDGWLVLSDYQTAYDKDFLYYMLSSRFAYYQFCGIVSGAVVKNLNTDKVESSFMPLPPLSEQKRIVAKIEELMPLIDDFNKA